MAKITEAALDQVLTAVVTSLSDDDLLYFGNIDDSNIFLDNKLYDRIISFFILSKRRTSIKKIRRAVICIAVICALLFGSAMSIEAVRTAVWEAVITWYEDYVGIYFKNEASEKAPPEYIEKTMVPSYIPEGWIINKTTDNNTIKIYNIESRGQSIIFIQYIYSDKEFWVDNNSYMQTVKINANTGYLYTCRDESSVLTWTDDYKFVLITSDEINADVLIKIAESVG